MDRGARQATVHRVAQSQAQLKRLKQQQQQSSIHINCFQLFAHFSCKESNLPLQLLYYKREYFCVMEARHRSIPVYWIKKIYWVDYKVCSDFSVRCYGKPEQTFFLATQYIKYAYNFITLSLILNLAMTIWSIQLHKAESLRFLLHSILLLELPS